MLKKLAQHIGLLSKKPGDIKKKKDKN